MLPNVAFATAHGTRAHGLHAPHRSKLCACAGTPTRIPSSRSLRPRCPRCSMPPLRRWRRHCRSELLLPAALQHRRRSLQLPLMRREAGEGSSSFLGCSRRAATVSTLSTSVLAEGASVALFGLLHLQQGGARCSARTWSPAQPAARRSLHP